MGRERRPGPLLCGDRRRCHRPASWPYLSVAPRGSSVFSPSDRRRRVGIWSSLFLLWLPAFLLFAIGQTGCGAAVSPRQASPAGLPPQSINPDMALGTGTRSVRLLVEPTDGVTPLIKAVDSAQRTVFVEAYILSNRRIVRALERAQARGTHVYVVLEPTPYG